MLNYYNKKYTGSVITTGKAGGLILWTAQSGYYNSRFKVTASKKYTQLVKLFIIQLLDNGYMNTLI